MGDKEDTMNHGDHGQSLELDESDPFKEVTVEVLDPLAAYNEETMPGEDSFNRALKREKTLNDFEKDTTIDIDIDDFDF